jgi:Spy/CpxP family protein refolding chaperone
MKTILAVALAVALSTSLGTAQDTTRTVRKADKLVPRRDSLRKVPRDSVRFLIGGDTVLWLNRDSVRWVLADIKPMWDSSRTYRLVADSIRWRISSAPFDPSRTYRSWDSVRSSPSVEFGSTTPPTAYSQNGNSTFAQYLFPPEFVMQHQSRLKLTEQQRNFIVGEITRLQATAVQVQWRVADESEKLSELLSHDSVAEAAALEQVDKVIGFETAVKRAQLSMLIRIRNVLTPEQRELLRSLQRPRE